MALVFMMILAIMVNVSFLSEAIAHASTPPAPVLITPKSGHVGDIVRVIGEINTTDGPYHILFDQEVVKDGTATGTAVNDTFIVPHRLTGNYTVTLHDLTTKSNYTSTEPFNIQTAYSVKAVVPTPPAQLKQGESTQIQVDVTGGTENTVYLANVAVTDPSGAVFHNSPLQLANTTNTGHGKGELTYPTDFGVGAHTNYTGTYYIRFNETLATANFTVGLTDRVEYARRYLLEGEEETGEVIIQGSGYDSESVTINIAYYNKTSLTPVAGYPKKENASDGMVTHKWKVPDNASLATYNVTLTSDIEKPVKDTQNFTLIEIIVSCQAQNKYDNNPLVGVPVNASYGTLSAGSGITNKTGWVDFRLDRHYYSFGVYWREVLVGSLSSHLEGKPLDYVLRINFYIKCELAHVTINVRDEDRPLPFIEVTIANTTSAPKKIPLLQTNYTGMVSTYAFTAVNYRIEARRYGHLFFNQSIGNVTKTIGNLTKPFQIICPTYTLFVYTSDSKENPIQNAPVEVVEWSSGRITAERETNEWGSVRINCTFGRYKVKIYDEEQNVVLNETVVDVIRNQFYLALRCRTANLDLSVKVIDRLRQPIPNAYVKIERKGLETLNLTTGIDGVASKYGILGGDYRISIYVAGRLCGIKSLLLDKSEALVFQAASYVMVGGYPLESNQLITGISLALLVVLSASIYIYRRRSQKSEKE